MESLKQIPSKQSNCSVNVTSVVSLERGSLPSLETCPHPNHFWTLGVGGRDLAPISTDQVARLLGIGAKTLP